MRFLADSDAGGSSGADGPRWVLLSVVLAVLAFAPALLHEQFSFDDAEAIVDNPLVAGALPALEAFERDYWEHLGRAGHYRPLAALSLRLDFALYGHDARGFHATNSALHAAVVALAGVVLLLVRAPARATPARWLGLALFAVHPALADSVAWISGRTSMLSALGGLIALAWVAHLTIPWRALSHARAAAAAAVCAAGMLAALLSKEDALVFAPLLALLGARHSRRLAVWVSAGVVVALVVYWRLRANVYGSGVPSAPHAPLAEFALVQRLAVGGRAFLEGLRLFAAPLGHMPNYEGAPQFSPRGSHWQALLGWICLGALLLGGAAALGRRSRRVLGVCALACAAACSTWMQWLPAGVVFAPRLLYLPALFAAPLVGALCARALQARHIRWSALGLLALVALAWQRSAVYASRDSYWREQLRWRPDDARAYNELGLTAHERGERDLARAQYDKAIELDASYGRPWSNLGRLLVEGGELEQAERAFERATHLGPGNPTAWSNLGSVRLRLRRFESARRDYTRAVELAPGRSSAWRGLARAELECGDLDAARFALERAQRLDPSDEAARELATLLRRRALRAAD